MADSPLPPVQLFSGPGFLPQGPSQARIYCRIAFPHPIPSSLSSAHPLIIFPGLHGPPESFPAPLPLPSQCVCLPATDLCSVLTNAPWLPTASPPGTRTPLRRPLRHFLASSLQPCAQPPGLPTASRLCPPCRLAWHTLCRASAQGSPAPPFRTCSDAISPSAQGVAIHFLSGLSAPNLWQHPSPLVDGDLCAAPGRQCVPQTAWRSWAQGAAQKSEHVGHVEQVSEE